MRVFIDVKRGAVTLKEASQELGISYHSIRILRTGTIGRQKFGGTRVNLRIVPGEKDKSFL